MTSRKYVLIFLAAVLPLCALAIYAHLRLPDYRAHPLDLSALKPQEFILMNGMTRQQTGNVKIGHMENAPPPAVGVFGNHQFRYFAEDALKANGINKSFFNYWYANLALPDILDLLTYLEQIGKLPSELIIVQVTSPNNDNGRYIVERSQELPDDIVFLSELHKKETGDTSMFAEMQSLFQGAINNFRTTFSYSSFLIGIFYDEKRGRIISLDDCAEKHARASGVWSAIVNRLPQTMRPVLGMTIDNSMFCDSSYAELMMKDGALRSKDVRQVLKKNVNDLDPQKARISVLDASRIAGYLSNINDLAKRNGLEAAVVIPPVYETARFSVVDQVFTQAMKQAPGVAYIDDRKAHDVDAYFVNYDHPSSAYYKALMAELLKRGLVASH